MGTDRSTARTPAEIAKDLLVITRAIGALNEIWSRAGRGTGLSPAGYNLLVVLTSHGSLALPEIRRSLGLPRSTMHDLISRLASQDMIEIEAAATDKRASDVKAGRNAAKAISDFESRVASLANAWLARSGRADLPSLIRAAGRLLSDI